MRRTNALLPALLALALLSLTAACSSAPPEEEGAAGLGSDDRNAIYAMGLNMAATLDRQEYTDAQVTLVQQALSDAAAAAAAGEDLEELEPPDSLSEGAETEAYQQGVDFFRSVAGMRLATDEVDLLKTAITDARAGTPQIDLETYRPLIAQLASNRANAAAEAERERSEAYLEEAAAKPGVEVTNSGLIYEELTPGSGRSPNTQNTVRVHYTGTLVDGTEFDSSRGRQPYEAHITSLIPCWTEGIRKMQVGGTARLTCPASLAYGENGLDPAVPPNAALIFEIELLGIQ